MTATNFAKGRTSLIFTLSLIKNLLVHVLNMCVYAFIFFKARYLVNECSPAGKALLVLCGPPICRAQILPMVYDQGRHMGLLSKYGVVSVILPIVQALVNTVKGLSTRLPLILALIRSRKVFHQFCILYVKHVYSEG